MEEGRIRKTPLLRSPDRKPGLTDISRGTSRKKEFRLEDGILYSYCRDPRFVSVVCGIIGFSAWWALAPEQLLEEPTALCAPDLKLVVQVVKDTFENRVCTYHRVSSPCECGEPFTFAHSNCPPERKNRRSARTLKAVLQLEELLEV